MANHCVFCDTRRPIGGTNILIAGEKWIEFCQPCGEKEILENAKTGEELTVRALFDRSVSAEEKSNA